MHRSDRRRARAPARAPARCGPPARAARPRAAARTPRACAGRPRRRASCRRARGSCGAGTCRPRSRTRAARRRRATAARTTSQSKQRVLGLARRERGEVVRCPTSAAAHALEQRRGPARRATSTRGALEHASACAARARGSSRSCCVASRRASKPVGAGSRREHRDVVRQQPVEAQRVDRLVRVAGDLAPGVHAARRCARRPSASAAAVVAVSPRTVRSARSSSSWTVRLSGWRAQPAKSVPSYSIVSLVIIAHARAARRCAAQTSSMKTISVASLRRGPSLRMRV